MRRNEQVRPGTFSRYGLSFLFVIPQRRNLLLPLRYTNKGMILYIATSNPGKLRDFAAAETLHVPIAPLPNLASITPPPEDEPTFEGNAIEKARYYSHHAPGEIVLADDSGLEVDALHGAPGVRSARFADDHNFHPIEPLTAQPFSTAAPFSTDQRNNLYLLSLLTGVPLTERSARYHCVLAAARNGHILAIGHGAVEGEILTTPRGTSGFGYDPLFYLPNEHKTMAELDIKTKLTFSHRGRAFAALLKALLPHLQPKQIQ
jgi:XTP/dITP diphosphohydrolase